MNTPAPSAEVFVMVGVVLLAALLYLGCVLLRKCQSQSQLPEKDEEAEGGCVSELDIGSADDLIEPLPNGTTYIHVISASYQLPNGFRVGPGMPARVLSRKDSAISEWYYSDSRPQTGKSRKSRRSSSVASVEIPSVLHSRLQQIADSRMTEVPEVSPSPIPSDIAPNPPPSELPPSQEPSDIAPNPPPSEIPPSQEPSDIAPNPPPSEIPPTPDSSVNLSNATPSQTPANPMPSAIINTPPLSTSLSALVSSRAGVWKTKKVFVLPDHLTDSFV